MELSAGEIDELRKGLYRHLIVLDAMLASPERWELDLHVPIAVQLRVLACDADLPMLQTYARARGKPLRVWGPSPKGTSAGPSELIFSFSALIASWRPVPDGFEMDFDDYLDTSVGTVSIPLGEGRSEGRRYSPRQIIKWVANKDGGAHFSFERPATLEVLRKSTWRRGETEVDSFQVKHVIFGVAEWTHHALVETLDLAT
jgi:hypothetical protein